MASMDEISTQIEYPRAMGLAAGDSVKVIVTQGGVETVLIDHSVPAGKNFSGSVVLRGQLA